jgi:hypothetical protein
MLGLDEGAIREEFSSLDIKSSRTSDNVYYMYFKQNSSTIAYYFKDGVSAYEKIIPDDVSSLNEYVRLFNKVGVAISNTEWKEYVSGKEIIIIDLIYEDGTSYFYLTLEKQ